MTNKVYPWQLDSNGLTYTGNVEPDINIYRVWIDTSSNPPEIKFYDEANLNWIILGTYQ